MRHLKKRGYTFRLACLAGFVAKAARLVERVLRRGSSMNDSVFGSVSGAVYRAGRRAGRLRQVERSPRHEGVQGRQQGVYAPATGARRRRSTRRRSSSIPNNAAIYFYLANSYDNMYRPTRKGEPNNDALLTKAIDNYKLASEKMTEETVPKRSLALQYLVGGVRPRQAERSDEGRAGREAHDRARRRTSRPTTSRWRKSTKTRASTSSPSKPI